MNSLLATVQKIKDFWRANSFWIIIIVALASWVISSERAKRSVDPDGPANPSTPVNPDTAPKVPYIDKVRSVFVSKDSVEDLGYLAGAFEAIALTLNEDAEADSKNARFTDSASFIAYWKDVSPHLTKQVQGSYTGFQGCVKEMLDNIDAINDAYKKKGPLFANPEHKHAVASEILLFKDALSARIEELLKLKK